MEDKNKINEYVKRMKSYIEQPDMYVPFPFLLNEMRDYEPFSKAYRVYLLCKRNGKHNIAARISYLYNLKMPKHDIVIASMYALLWEDSLKKKDEK